MSLFPLETKGHQPFQLQLFYFVLSSGHEQLQTETAYSSTRSEESVVSIPMWPTFNSLMKMKSLNCPAKCGNMLETCFTREEKSNVELTWE